MRFNRIILTLAMVCLVTTPAYGKKLSVACAANFTAAMKQLVELYEQETSHTVVCTFGSTGMLYGQIINKAPYDIFFAADEKRPELLFNNNLSTKPVRYATGQVVLWSASNESAKIKDWKEMVSSPLTRRIGLATPKTAPYGLRAMQALESAGLLATAEPKIVYGKSVSIVFQYAYSKAAQASFVAHSQAVSTKGKNGQFWFVPEAGPVHQGACVLKSGNSKQAEHFLNWMSTQAARTIIRNFGYE